MADRYTRQVFDIIDEISPKISKNLGTVTQLPESIGVKILSVIISYACQPQNIGLILIARKIFKKIQPEWVNNYIDKAIEMRLNLQEEWEYRRLMELLSASIPELPGKLEKYITLGLASSNVEVKEAAEDFKEKFEMWKKLLLWDRNPSLNNEYFKSDRYNKDAILAELEKIQITGQKFYLDIAQEDSKKKVAIYNWKRSNHRLYKRSTHTNTSL